MRKVFVLCLVLVSLIVVPGCALTGSEPPVVTHQVAGDYADCRGCHEEGINGAPKTDHARKDDCLSCHAAVPEE